MNYTTPGNSTHSKLCCLIVCSPAEVFHGLPQQYCWGKIVVACPPHSIVGIVGYSSIQPLFFFVRAEVFHGVIVASPSCTEYH